MTKSFALAVAIQPGLWVAMSRRYPGDSLFTLNVWEIIGLTILSSSMALLLLIFVLWKSRTLHRVVKTQGVEWPLTSRWLFLDITTTIVICLIALWLAPQIHYTYYQMIIDSLPMQWVVGGGLDFHQLLRLAILRTDGSIAEHATGIVIWVCVLSSVLNKVR